MPYVRPNIINKQTSPIFNCVNPVSVSLATLARQIYIYCEIMRESAPLASLNKEQEVSAQHCVFLSKVNLVKIGKVNLTLPYLPDTIE